MFSKWRPFAIVLFDRFLVLVRSAVKSNITAWCNQILSNRALDELTQSFQIFSTFAIVDTTQPTKDGGRYTANAIHRRT